MDPLNKCSPIFDASNVYELIRPEDLPPETPKDKLFFFLRNIPIGYNEEVKALLDKTGLSAAEYGSLTHTEKKRYLYYLGQRSEFFFENCGLLNEDKYKSLTNTEKEQYVDSIHQMVKKLYENFDLSDISELFYLIQQIYALKTYNSTCWNENIVSLTIFITSYFKKIQSRHLLKDRAISYLTCEEYFLYYRLLKAVNLEKLDYNELPGSFFVLLSMALNDSSYHNLIYSAILRGKIIEAGEYHSLNKDKKNLYQELIENLYKNKLLSDTNSKQKLIEAGQVKDKSSLHTLLINGHRFTNKERSELFQSSLPLLMSYTVSLVQLDLPFHFSANERITQVAQPILDAHDSSQKEQQPLDYSPLNKRYFHLSYQSKNFFTLYDKLKTERLTIADYMFLSREEKIFYQDCLSVARMCHPVNDENKIRRLLIECIEHDENQRGQNENFNQLMKGLVQGGRINKYYLTPSQYTYYCTLLKTLNLISETGFPSFISKELFFLLGSTNTLERVLSRKIKISQAVYRSLTPGQQKYYQDVLKKVGCCYTQEKQDRLVNFVKTSYNKNDMQDKLILVEIMKEKLENALIHGSRLTDISRLTSEENQYYETTLKDLNLDVESPISSHMPHSSAKVERNVKEENGLENVSERKKRKDPKKTRGSKKKKIEESSDFTKN